MTTEPTPTDAARPSCHECGEPATDTCVRCGLPTDDRHFYEQEHLGLCSHCGADMEAALRRGGMMVAWPYPLRNPIDKPLA